MATYTENYNLIKPDSEDYYDIQDFNDNMDSVDTLLAEAEAATESINEKIGTPTEAGQTLFSLLQNGSAAGFTAIKSLQRVVCPENKNQDFPINTVVPENCLVLSQRLFDASNTGCCSFEYTLTATSLHATCNSLISVEFWIIEFC